MAYIYAIANQIKIVVSMIPKNLEIFSMIVTLSFYCGSNPKINPVNNNITVHILQKRQGLYWKSVMNCYIMNN